MLKIEPPDMRFSPANETDYLYEPLDLLWRHATPVPMSFSSVVVKRNSQIGDECYQVLPEKRRQL